MQWEYKTLKLETTGLAGGILDENKLAAMMNSLGAEGWELVAAFDTNMAQGASRYVITLFKRPRGTVPPGE